MNDKSMQELFELDLEDIQFYYTHKKFFDDMHEESMTDEKGNVTKYMVYEAQAVDVDGVIYTYKLKLAQESDKSYLNILMQL